MNRRKMIRVSAAAAVALGLVPGRSWAQKRSVAERRQHPGKGYWSNRSASRRMGHALDYSRSLSDYARRAEAVDPEFAKAQVDEIGRHISVAQQQIETVRKEAAQRGDKQTVADVDRIRAELNDSAKAYAHCKEHCAKTHVNTAQLSKSADRVTKSLESASKVHLQTMKRLYPEASSGTDTE